MASELSKIVLKKDDMTEVQVYLHGKNSGCYMCDVEITSVYYKKYGFVNESSKQQPKNVDIKNMVPLYKTTDYNKY